MSEHPGAAPHKGKPPESKEEHLRTEQGSERDVKRFFAQVEKTDWCWLWRGAKAGSSGRPYGRFVVNGKAMPAHRFVYELLVGPIPDGLVIDHVCRNTVCVNPNHLEPVTDRVNTLRGISPVAQNARKTHCKRGHELVGENLTLRRRNRFGQLERECRACKRMFNRARFMTTEAKEALMWPEGRR